MSSLIKSFLLPPGSILILLILGIVLIIYRKRRLGLTLFWVSVIALYLLSTTFIANLLLSPLEHYRALYPKDIKTTNAKAIVILAAGSKYAPEFGGSGPTSTSLERAYYAADLYKLTKLPILISGGEVKGEPSVESTQMKRLLENSFNVPVWKIEPQSRNTYQNAKYTAKLLKENNIKRFYLVTSAWHMRRSLWAFHQFGLNPIPAPTDFAKQKHANWLKLWLPNPAAFVRSYLALHEYLGYLCYQLLYRT